jgi:hypothetical protein
MSRLGSRGHITSAVALTCATAMAAMMLLLTGGSPASSANASAARAGGLTFTRVAHNPQGFARSAISGQTANGHRVTGYFTPTGVNRHNGHLRMRGMVNGVIHQANGKTRTFNAMRTLRIASMNGTTPGASRTAAAAAAGSCSILHLVLGPLNLDLLGLKVHLNKVVLNVDAQSGSGQLLGNLLCAVAHLLDGNGTLGQLLTQLQNILNQLLAGL